MANLQYDQSTVKYDDPNVSYDGDSTTSLPLGKHAFSYQFEIYNEYNGKSFTINKLTNNEGVFLNDYPIFTVDVRNKSMEKQGQHGVFDFRSFYGGRAISFNCKIVAKTPEKTQEIIDNIRNTLALPPQPSDTNTGYVRIRWTDVNGQNWEIYARMTADQAEKRGLDMPLISDFLIQLKASDPVIKSQDYSTQSGYQGWKQGALKLDFESPALIPYEYNLDVEATNSGTYESPTICKLYGYCKKPTIYNITTGVGITINYEIQDNDWIIINAEKGIVTNSAGEDITGLVTGESNFVYLIAGTNRVIYYDAEILNSAYFTHNSENLKSPIKSTPFIDKTNRDLMILDDMYRLSPKGTWTPYISSTSSVNDSNGQEIVQYVSDKGVKIDMIYNDYSNNTFGLQCTRTTPENWTSIYNNGTIRIKVTLNDISGIASIRFRFGSDSSNYYEATATTQWDGSAFIVGQNTIEYSLAGLTPTGSPVITAINYLAVICVTATAFGRTALTSKGGQSFSCADCTGDVDQAGNGWMEANSNNDWYLSSLGGAPVAQFDTAIQRTSRITARMDNTTTGTRHYLMTADGRSDPFAGTLKYLRQLKASTTYRMYVWVKTVNATSNGVKLRIIPYNSSLAALTATTTQSLTGDNDWTLLIATFTTASTAQYYQFQCIGIDPAGNVSQEYFDVLNLRMEEIYNDTDLETGVKDYLRPAIQGVSDNNWLSYADRGAAYANTYQIPTAVSEGATNLLTLNPGYNIHSIQFYLATKGTGTITVYLHDSSNNIVDYWTLTNASLAVGWNTFYVYTPPTATLHCHVISSVNDSYLKCNTSNDLTTASYQLFMQTYTYNSEIICNGERFKLDMENGNDLGLNHNAIVDLDNGSYYAREVLKTGVSGYSRYYYGNIISSVNTAVGRYEDQSNGMKLYDNEKTNIIKKYWLGMYCSSVRLGAYVYIPATRSCKVEWSIDGTNWNALRTFTSSDSSTWKYDTISNLNTNVIYFRWNGISSATYVQIISVLGQRKKQLETSFPKLHPLNTLNTLKYSKTVSVACASAKLVYGKYCNENDIPMPALELWDTANATGTIVGYIPLTIDNSQETNPCVSVLSTSTNWQQAGNGSNDGSTGYILNADEYINLTGGATVLNFYIQIGYGTTTISGITKNTLYISSNNYKVKANYWNSYQSTLLFPFRKSMQLDEVKYYKDSWVGTITKDYTNYQIDDSATKLTTVVGGTEVSAYKNKTISFLDCKLSDYIISNQYISGFANLVAYGIRFYQGANYADMQLPIPTSDGWIKNKILISDLVLSGITTPLNSFDKITIYAQSSAGNVAYVTFSGIELDKLIANPTSGKQKFDLSWRTAKI